MTARNYISLPQISNLVAVGILLAWPASTWSQTITVAIPVGAAPKAVAVNKATNKIYAADYLGIVTVIDGTTNSTTTVRAGSHPLAVAVNAANRVYVADYGKTPQFGSDRGGVTVIDGATNSATTVTNPNANGLTAWAIAVKGGSKLETPESKDHGPNGRLP